MTNPGLTDGGVLFSDLYQFTMAQVYFEHGMADRRAYYEHFFRSYPSYGNTRAGFCVSAGLESLLDRLSGMRFGRAERSVLASMRSPTGRLLFTEPFLDWLEQQGGFEQLRICAVRDGQVVHPHAPMTVVEGPLALAQLVETALLNHRNFGTLIATKAARVKHAARGATVIEFGMRRAAGLGAVLATEAALIGGADFSSNVETSHRLGLSPRGTHAHSMVQAFTATEGDELDAFRAFARVYPDDCVLLVDTVDVLASGVPNAVTVFEELRQAGHRPVGVRLDSGDPVTLVPETMRMLDEAGFDDTAVVLSDSLDEHTIARVTTRLNDDRTLRRLVFGVGTRLVTSHGAPSLGGVYKLAAVSHGNRWAPVSKLVSDDPAKGSLPGRKNVWRCYGSDGRATADMVSLADETPPACPGGAAAPVLEEVWNGGRVTGRESLDTARRRRRDAVSRLDVAYQDLTAPKEYTVTTSASLAKLRADSRKVMG